LPLPCTPMMTYFRMHIPSHRLRSCGPLDWLRPG
jgi:hypothetical protein